MDASSVTDVSFQSISVNDVHVARLKGGEGVGNFGKSESSRHELPFMIFSPQE